MHLVHRFDVPGTGRNSAGEKTMEKLTAVLCRNFKDVLAASQTKTPVMLETSALAFHCEVTEGRIYPEVAAEKIFADMKDQGFTITGMVRGDGKDPSGETDPAKCLRMFQDEVPACVAFTIIDKVLRGGLKETWYDPTQNLPTPRVPSASMKLGAGLE
jgi:hypothetical protein